MSPQIVVLVIALTIGFSVLLDLAVFLLYILTLPAELDVQAPLLDDIDAAEQFPFPVVAAEGAVPGVYDQCLAGAGSHDQSRSAG